MKHCLFIIAASLLWPLSAYAKPSQAAQNAFAIGQYEQSVILAKTEGSPDALVLASESIVAKILSLKSEDMKDDAKRARDLAEAAISLDPSNGEAFLQYAIADGIVTRSTGNLKVWRKKLAQKTLLAINNADANLPDDPRVDALRGAWHLGIVRKAGVKRARKMFEANVDDGVADFERGLAKSPNDIVLAVNYALSTLALDVETYGPRAKEVLQSTGQTTPTNALERQFQDWAVELLELYGKPKDLQDRAEFILDGE